MTTETGVGPMGTEAGLVHDTSVGALHTTDSHFTSPNMTVRFIGVPSLYWPKLRPVTVTGDARSASRPDTPTTLRT